MSAADADTNVPAFIPMMLSFYCPLGMAVAARYQDGCEIMLPVGRIHRNPKVRERAQARMQSSLAGPDVFEQQDTTSIGIRCGLSWQHARLVRAHCRDAIPPAAPRRWGRRNGGFYGNGE